MENCKHHFDPEEHHNYYKDKKGYCYCKCNLCWKLILLGSAFDNNVVERKAVDFDPKEHRLIYDYSERWGEHDPD